MARTPPDEDPRDPLLCARAGISPCRYRTGLDRTGLMASAPSASALSAVLRCRRNLWTAPSARLTGSTARDLPVQTASLWDAFTRGERIVLGRLALSCHVPWKKRNAEKVSQSRARTDGHAHRQLCTRISVRAHRAKVVFVCDRNGGRTRLDPSDWESACLWARGACVSMTSPLSHLVLVNLRVLFRCGTGPEHEEPQSPGATAESSPAEGAVRGARIAEDRPD